jgi:hypothetical protein
MRKQEYRNEFTYQTTGYNHPVKFVTIALIFCYESPDSVVTKPLLRAFVLSIRYESQTKKKRDELQHSHR